MTELNIGVNLSARSVDVGIIHRGSGLHICLSPTDRIRSDCMIGQHGDGIPELSGVARKRIIRQIAASNLLNFEEIVNRGKEFIP